MRPLVVLTILISAHAAEPDWNAVNQETLRHYSALVRIDDKDNVAAARMTMLLLKRQLIGTTEKTPFSIRLVQERLREKELYRFTQYNWEVVRTIAGH